VKLRKNNMRVYVNREWWCQLHIDEGEKEKFKYTDEEIRIDIFVEGRTKLMIFEKTDMKLIHHRIKEALIMRPPLHDGKGLEFPPNPNYMRSFFWECSDYRISK
jgi:hypothetical protein